MQESNGQTQGIRGSQITEDFRTNSDGSEAFERASGGVGNQSVPTHRESSSQGISSDDTIGGVLDQLIDDAERQLVKSQECIDWYRQEVKEYEAKLGNLRKLKQLQEQKQQQQQEEQQQQEQQQTESSNHSGENLAE